MEAHKYCHIQTAFNGIGILPGLAGSLFKVSKQKQSLLRLGIKLAQTLILGCKN
jgi:hypothetical protein